jgi:hypothetical protein
MLDFRRLAHESDDELDRRDIIDKHLACADGLPGSDNIDLPRCHNIVTEWAEGVKPYTNLLLAKGVKVEPDDTEAKVRIRAMIQFLWRGAGLRYNPAKRAEDCVWELPDAFVHGALYGDGGTCGTLAIVYAAVGRRLGYPVKLATSRSPKWGHVFCRWEDPNGEVFNFEANSTGVGFMSDDHYREKGLTPEVEKGGLFLKSLTPRQELAMFLSERATQAYECGRLFECVDAWAYAWSLSPENVIYLNTLEDRYEKWQEDLNRRTPPGFPKGWFKVTQRRYPVALPLAWEQKIICHQAVDHLLNDPGADSRWWAPLRQGDRWARTPQDMWVDSRPGGLDVVLR